MPRKSSGSGIEGGKIPSKGGGFSPPKPKQPKPHEIVLAHGDVLRVRSAEGHEMEIRINQLSCGLELMPLHDQYLTVDYDTEERRSYVNVHILPHSYRKP